MSEGNPMSVNGFMMGSKPIPIPIFQPYDTVWSYHISRGDTNDLAELKILKEGQPYWIFCARERGDVRDAMEALFDLLSSMSKDLPVNEVANVLSMVSEITYDLTGIKVCVPSPAPAPAPSSTSSSSSPA
jgi:hypothetical protein